MAVVIQISLHVLFIDLERINRLSGHRKVLLKLGALGGGNSAIQPVGSTFVAVIMRNEARLDRDRAGLRDARAE